MYFPNPLLDTWRIVLRHSASTHSCSIWCLWGKKVHRCSSCIVSFISQSHMSEKTGVCWQSVTLQERLSNLAQCDMQSYRTGHSCLNATQDRCCAHLCPVLCLIIQMNISRHNFSICSMFPWYNTWNMGLSQVKVLTGRTTTGTMELLYPRLFSAALQTNDNAYVFYPESGEAKGMRVTAGEKKLVQPQADRDGKASDIFQEQWRPGWLKPTSTGHF